MPLLLLASEIGPGLSLDIHGSHKRGLQPPGLHMKRIVVSGWKTGFNKIGFTKFLRAEFGHSLSTAKGITDGVLKYQPVTLEIDDVRLERILSELTELRAEFRSIELERLGLLRAALGEAIGGFAARSFSATERSAAVELHERILGDLETPLSADDLRLFGVTLEFALKELGPAEFQTITGYDFEFAKATLTELQDAS